VRIGGVIMMQNEITVDKVENIGGWIEIRRTQLPHQHVSTYFRCSIRYEGFGEMFLHASTTTRFLVGCVQEVENT
jgi:hypothetical protein